MELLNLRLMSHPVNWLFVGAVLALFTIAYHQAHLAISSNAAAGSIQPD